MSDAWVLKSCTEGLLWEPSWGGYGLHPEPSSLGAFQRVSANRLAEMLSFKSAVVRDTERSDRNVAGQVASSDSPSTSSTSHDIAPAFTVTVVSPAANSIRTLPASQVSFREEEPDGSEVEIIDVDAWSPNPEGPAPLGERAINLMSATSLSHLVAAPSIAREYIQHVRT